MKNKPRTRAELHEGLAWVYRQCEGTSMEGREWECIKLWGQLERSNFDLLAAPCDYEFMLGLLEGKPVFEGDCVYNVKNRKYFNVGRYIKADWLDEISWQKPKETITIESVELPRPINGADYDYCSGDITYRFDTEEDRVHFSRSLCKIINRAIEQTEERQ